MCADSVLKWRERVKVFRLYDNQNEVNMRCLYNHVADPHGVELSRGRKAAPHDRLT